MMGADFQTNRENKMSSFESRTYKHPTVLLALMVLVFGILAIVVLVTSNWKESYILIPFAGFLGVVFLILLFSLSSSATISDTGISSQNLLGAKSLNWTEISRVSGSGYRIKLHNLDGDVTVAPSPQLPGYEEIVERIGIKRPDLFDPQESGRMTRNWMNLFAPLTFALVILVFAALSVFESGEAWLAPLFFAIMAVTLWITVFSSPQSITIEGNSIFIKYLFNEKALPADEVESVQLMFQKSRNGKRYHIVIGLPGKKSVRISSMNPGLPIVYLTLKNWHEKNSAAGQMGKG